MTERRSASYAKPISVTITTPEGEPRTVTCHRVTFRHSQPWLEAWVEWASGRAGDAIDWHASDRGRMTRLALAIVKAGLPEPDPENEHPRICVCSANAGLHAQLDVLAADEFEELFEAVLEVNRPKGAAPRTPAGAGLPRGNRWSATALVGFVRRTLGRDR